MKKLQVPHNKQQIHLPNYLLTKQLKIIKPLKQTKVLKELIKRTSHRVIQGKTHKRVLRQSSISRRRTRSRRGGMIPKLTKERSKSQRLMNQEIQKMRPPNLETRRLRLEDPVKTALRRQVNLKTELFKWKPILCLRWIQVWSTNLQMTMKKRSNKLKKMPHLTLNRHS